MKKKLDLKSASVLLVDDDHFLRDMYAKKFAEHVGQVETAGSAEEAVERLRGGLAPALIVFDLVMPGIGGYGLIEIIRKEHLAPKAIKIALSNQSGADEIACIMDLGTDGHLTKANATPSEIVEKILEMVA